MFHPIVRTQFTDIIFSVTINTLHNSLHCRLVRNTLLLSLFLSPVPRNISQTLPSWPSPLPEPRSILLAFTKLRREAHKRKREWIADRIVKQGEEKVGTESRNNTCVVMMQRSLSKPLYPLPRKQPSVPPSPRWPSL